MRVHFEISCKYTVFENNTKSLIQSSIAIIASAMRIVVTEHFEIFTLNLLSFIFASAV